MTKKFFVQFFSNKIKEILMQVLKQYCRCKTYQSHQNPFLMKRKKEINKNQMLIKAEMHHRQVVQKEMLIRPHRSLSMKCWQKINNRCTKKNRKIKPHYKDNNNLSNWCFRMTWKTTGKSNKLKNWGDKRENNKELILQRTMIQIHQVTCLKILQIKLRRNLQDLKASLAKSNQTNNYQKWQILKFCKKI